MRDELPVKLAQQGLKINESKTREYTIKRTNCDNRWRHCKLLGSLLDTQNDIKRRKVLAINAANKLKHLFLLSIMKQQLRSELNMNWNEAFDIAKDENV